MRYLKYILSLYVLFYGCGQAFAEPNHQYRFFTAQYHYQRIWPHRPELKQYSENPATSFELQLGWKTSGTLQWHHLYNLPSYGLGFYYSDLGNPDVLGQVRSGFVFMEFLLDEKYMSKSKLKISLGLSHFNTYYEPNLNPENSFIGTPWNVHFNVNYSRVFTLSENVRLSPGVSFTHFSNGAYKKPNRGLNIYDVNIGLRYRFGNNEISGYAPEKDFQSKQFEEQTLFATFSMGFMQRNIGDPIYQTMTMSFNHTIRKSHRTRWGVGMDVSTNGHARAQIRERDDKAGFKDGVSLGGFASCDIVFNRMAVMLNLGTYLYYSYEPRRSIYKRVGLRYLTESGLTGHMALKAHEGRAEYVEWGIGYGFSF